MRDKVSSVFKNAASEASRNASDEEQIWETLRAFIIFGLIIEVLILFILSVDMQIELLGMQIAYTAAIIGAPIFILGLVILILGNKNLNRNKSNLIALFEFATDFDKHHLNRLIVDAFHVLLQSHQP